MEWHDFPLKPTILELVAQLSSRVFLGDKICRDPDWLRITIAYTLDAFQATEELRTWPDFLRPFVARFLKSCSRVRTDLREAREIITPVLEARRKSKEAASIKGEAVARYNDAMEWMEQTSKGRPYDHAAVQLTFSLSAIHTTSDMMTQAIYDLCNRQELIQALRKEIIDVISAEGWKKTAMYKLQLMDSFLKESQRMKPINMGRSSNITTKVAWLLILIQSSVHATTGRRKHSAQRRYQNRQRYINHGSGGMDARL